MPSSDRWTWSEKLPLILAALAALLAAGFLLCWQRSRPLTLAGAILIVVGLLLLWQSTQVAEWCRPPNRAFGQVHWGQGFWHEPSLIDCIRLTR